MAKTFTAKVRLEAEDAASPALKRTGKQFDKLSKDVDALGDEFARTSKKASSFSQFLKSRFVITLGDVARTVQGAFRAVSEAADLSGQEVALRNQLKGIEGGFDSYISKLEEVSRNTVSTADLISSSSRALLLGIPAEEISSLLEIATAAAQATGDSVSKSFDDITKGIGRASPLILDNLGIVVSIEDAYARYADEIGKTASSLSEAEKKQAFLNETLRAGRKIMADVGDSTETLRTRLDRATAAMTNLKNVLSEALAGFAVGATEASNLADGIDGASSAANGLNTILSTTGTILGTVFGAVVKLGELIPKAIGRAVLDFNRLNGSLEVTVENTDSVNNRLKALDDTTESFGANARRSREEVGRLAAEYDAADVSAEKLRRSTFQLTRQFFKSLIGTRDEIKAKQKLLETERALADLRGVTSGALARAGIRTQTELRNQLELLHIELASVVELTKEGELNDLQSAQAKQKLEQEINAVKAVLEGTVPNVEAYTQAVVEAAAADGDLSAAARVVAARLELSGEKAQEAEGRVRGLTAANIELAESQDRVKGSFLSGGEFQKERTTGFTLSGGTFTTVRNTQTQRRRRFA